MKGENNTLELLLATPIPLLRSIIKGKLAKDLRDDPEVKRAVDAAAVGGEAGIYVLIAERDQGGRFLSRTERGRYQQLK